MGSFFSSLWHRFSGFPYSHIFVLLGILFINWIISFEFPKIGLITSGLFIYVTAIALCLHRLKRDGIEIDSTHIKSVCLWSLILFTLGVFYGGTVLLFTEIAKYSRSPLLELAAKLERSPLGLILPTIYTTIGLVFVESKIAYK